MAEPAKPAAEPALVNAVPFNHKKHEEKNENCSVCHHTASTKGVVACSQCHTSLGKEEGAFITTEQAMHRVTAKTSCVGCHAQAQEKKQCAGCHTFMGRTGQKTRPAAPSVTSASPPGPSCSRTRPARSTPRP